MNKCHGAFQGFGRNGLGARVYARGEVVGRDVPRIGDSVRYGSGLGWAGCEGVRLGNEGRERARV